jgi:hypothetical protein
MHTRMTRGRVGLVHAVIALIIGGSGYAIVTNRECWPFSPYPMYSWVERNRSVSRLQLFGLTEGAKPQEIPLVAFRHLQPFDDARLYAGLQGMQGQPNSEQALREALSDLLTRYENLRRAGRHDGPLLQGIRLYYLVWQKIDPRSFKPADPDQRTLVSEVTDTSLEKR